jgi:hypothetical protein
MHAVPLMLSVRSEPSADLTARHCVHRRCNFTFRLGFCEMGAPRELVSARPRLGEQLAAGSLLTAQAAAERMQAAFFWKNDTWRYVGGHADQGLFWAVPYLELGGGTWSVSLSRSRRWHAQHFMAFPKVRGTAARS